MLMPDVQVLSLESLRMNQAAALMQRQ